MANQNDIVDDAVAEEAMTNAEADPPMGNVGVPTPAPAVVVPAPAPSFRDTVMAGLEGLIGTLDGVASADTQGASAVEALESAKKQVVRAQDHVAATGIATAESISNAITSHDGIIGALQASRARLIQRQDDL